MDSCNDLIPRRIIFDAKDGIDAMPTFDMQSFCFDEDQQISFCFDEDRQISFCFDEDQQISLTIDFKFDTPLDRDVDTTFHWSFDLNESFCFDEEKNKLIKKVILCKKELYNMTRSLRSHAHRHFSFGTTGAQGGVDGEFTTVVMYPVLRRIVSESSFTDPDRYGVDLGHGSATAILAYFNSAVNLKMVGIEINDMRYLYSIRRQDCLSRSKRLDFKQLSRMCILYHGNAADILISQLSARPRKLFLVYWFREGWSRQDIMAVVFYLNFVPNLEWIICDLSFDKLVSMGYEGRLRNESTQHRGKMYASSNSRTLHVHHVYSPAKSALALQQADLDKEDRVVASFGTHIVTDHAKLEILRLEEKYSACNRIGRVKKAVN